MIRRQRLPGQLVIQMTDHCNARCPQCGMRVTNGFARTRLATADIKAMLRGAAKMGVQAVSFTGGEPVLFLEELAELIRYAGNLGISFIRTGTNGFFMQRPGSPGFEGRVRRVVKTLADTPLRNFWISIDSADPDTHSTMRGFDDLIDGLARALPIFHAHGIYPAANLGINRNLAGRPLPVLGPDADAGDRARFYRAYKSAFRRFYRFVADLGFTMVNTCYPMSVEADPTPGGLRPVYAATAEDAVVRFGKQEKSILFQALLETIGEFRSRLRIFSPRCSLYRLSRFHGGDPSGVYPCRGGIDFFFVSAGSGHAFPCGYRGQETFGKFQHMEGLPGPPKGPGCFQCDWECFRDPSELFGPLLRLATPLSLVREMRRDPIFFRLWKEDLAYYRACGFFHGRRPPDPSRMAGWDAATLSADNRPGDVSRP